MALAQRYGEWLNTHPKVDIADVCLTAGAGRSHFEHRAALVVDSVQGAREVLADLAENRLRPGVVRGECTDRPTTAWLFTGQGSQYPGMARELFDAEPVFADTVTRCADAVNRDPVRARCWRCCSLPTARPAVRPERGWAHVVCAARAVRCRDGPGPAMAVVGSRARRRAGAQRRPVRGGLCGRSFQPRGRGTADGRARQAVWQSARRWANGGGVRRRQVCRGDRQRVPPSVGRRLQRPQHGAVGSRRGSRTDRRHMWQRRDPMQLAGNQPRLPFGVAGAGAR